MARISHTSPLAALIYQHATRERDQAVASFLDDVVAATKMPVRTPVVDLRGLTGGPVQTLSVLTSTFYRGGERNRTAVRGFAGRCLNHSATPPWMVEPS